MPGSQEHEWSRYVSDHTTTSNDDLPLHSAEPVPVERLHDLVCLVLLGEPGIGKTHVFDRLRYGAVGAQTIEVDLGRHKLNAIERLFRESIVPTAQALGDDGGLHLFFDSVDESTESKKRLVRVLLEQLGALAKVMPLGRLRLRFASRPVEWPTALQRGLETLLSPVEEQPEQRWLLPLERQGLEQAAKSELETDADDFVARVVASGIEPIASRPVALNLLFLLWRRGDRELPRARVDIYDRGLRCMLKEAWYEGRESLSLETSYELAQLLAGLMLLNNWASIWAGQEGAETSSSLTVVDVVSALEPRGDQDPDELTRQLRALLENLPLGKSEQEGEWRFAHRSFAEFLAAKWLACSHADERSLILILTDNSAEPGRRRFIPQLSGVAAWLADLRPGMFERLLAYDPELVLLTDLAAREPELKRRTVAALLLALDTERVDEWEWHDLLGKLRHDGLSSQLRPWIGDRERHLFARRTAIRIAEECQIDDLEDALRGVIDEPVDENNLRELSARALIESFRRTERWDDIRRLAEDKAESDTNESILGDTLRALWPDHLEFEGLVSLCRQPRQSSHFGLYRLFLSHEFVPGLQEHELLDALRWLIRLKTEWRHDAHLLDDAWAHLLARLTTASSLSDREVAEGLVAPLFDGPNQIRYGGYSEVVAEFITVTTAARRQAALEVCVERLTRQSQKTWSIAQNLAANDGPQHAIAIGLARAGTPEERVAFELAQWLSDLGQAEDIERLRAVAGESEVAREVLQPLLELGETAEEIVEEIQRRRQPERRPPRPPLDPPPAQRVAQRVQQVLAGDIEVFPDLLFHQLALAPGANRPQQRVPRTIDQTPGWQAADEQLRQDIGRAAKAWLLNSDPQEDQWLGTSNLFEHAITGLLVAGHLFAHHTERYAEVSSEVWGRWSMAILLGTSSMNWQDQPLVPLRDGIDANPTVFAQRLGRHLRGKDTSPSVYLRRLQTVWQPALSVLMRSLINEAANDESQADAVFDYATAWIEYDATGEFVVDDDVRFATPVRAAIHAAHLKAKPEAHWDRIWPTLLADDELAKLVFFRVSEGQWGRSTFATTMETPERMGALVERLTELFPPNEDPRHDRARVISQRDSVAELRDGTLRHLANLGSRAAAETLLAMQQRGLGSSSRAELRTLAQEAIRRALAGEWRPRSLVSLARLVLGGRRATIYLSSRFESPLREPVRVRLSEHYDVLVTEDRARATSVFDAIRDDAEQADVMVQALEWSSGLGNREQTGGAYLEQEQVVARVLRRALLVGVLEDAEQCPQPLARYLTELRQGHVLLKGSDPEQLTGDLAKSVDDHFDRMTR